MFRQSVRRCFATGMEAVMRVRLDSLRPVHLYILDESASHSRGRESHFNVLVVAEQFTGLSRVKKQQLVYGLLAEELRKIHALTLTCKTPEEWKSKSTRTDSPGCVGKEPL